MSPSLYQPLYLILVTIITFVVMKDYAKWKYRFFIKYDFSKKNYAILLALFLTFFIGLRPIDERYFVDMFMYDYSYYFTYYAAPFFFDWNADNIIFDNLFAWMGAHQYESGVFFFIISTIYFICMLIACLKLFPKDTMLAFIVYLGAFSTFSFGTNGIKAGAAASLFLIALAYYKKSKIIVIIFLLLALGFHHSMKAPLIAYVIAYYYKKPKTYLYGWVFCLLLAAAHVTIFMSIFAGYTDEHGASYLKIQTGDTAKNVSGFRPDFILYSAIPIIIGYYLITVKKIKSERFIFLWCVYTLTNCVFLLCTYGSFINRIAYLSWLMIPFVLLYPFTNIRWSNQQDQYLRYVVLGHLGFTLFMNFIYY